MEKKSVSSRKTLKSLFSRSEVNLTEPEPKTDSSRGSLRLFKWKKKKKNESSEDTLNTHRTESVDGEIQDGEEQNKHKTALFGRSKKEMRSYSEMDLRKPKGFIASLTWKKKKKKKKNEDLFQDLTSNSEISGVKDHISEQDEFDNQKEIEQTQVCFEAVRSTSEPPCASDQCQHVLSDLSTPSEEDLGFMPTDQESKAIPYIDSDSDVYQTPPDSPNISSDAQAEPNAQYGKLSAQNSITSETSEYYICPVTDMKTAASTDTSTVCNSLDNVVSQKKSHLEHEEYSNVTSGKQERYISRPESSNSSIHKSFSLSIPQISTSSIPQSSSSSDPQISTSLIPESSSTSVPQISTSTIPQDSSSSVPQISTSSIPQGSSTSVPQISTSSIPQGSSTSAPQISTSSIPQGSSSSDPQISISSIPKSSSTSVPQMDTSPIPQSSFTPVPQISTSSIPQSSSYPDPQISTSSYIPQSSTSTIHDGFNLNSTMTKSFSTNTNSALTLPEDSFCHPANIISAKAEDSKTTSASFRNKSFSDRDVVNTDTSSAIAGICESVLSMPDVIVASNLSSRITENSMETERKLPSSNINVSKSDLTAHSTSESGSLEETHPESNCETNSKESHPTNNYSSLTCATDSEKHNPAQPVLPKNESNSSLSPSARTYTIIKSTKTVTFELSDSSEPISPVHSHRPLSKNELNSDEENLTKILDHEGQENNQTNSDNSDVPDRTISSMSLTSEASNHSPLLLDVSDQMLKAKTEKQQKTFRAYVDQEEYLQDASTQRFIEKSFDESETNAERMTTRDDATSITEDTKLHKVSEEFAMVEKKKDELHMETEQQQNTFRAYEDREEYLQDAATQSLDAIDQINQNKSNAEVTEATQLYKALGKVAMVEKKSDELHIDTKQLKASGAYEDCEEYAQDASTQRLESFDQINQNKSNAERMTTRNDATSIQDAESEQIIEATKLHKVSEKFAMVEKKSDESHMDQISSALKAEACKAAGVLTGQAEPQIPSLSTPKPAIPVYQEHVPEECTPAPPFSEPLKVSLTDSSMQPQSHLDNLPLPLALHQSRKKITILEDTAGCKQHSSTDKNTHIDALSRTLGRESQDCSIEEISSAYRTKQTFTHSSDSEQVEVKADRDKITHNQISESTSDDTKRKEDTDDLADQTASDCLTPGESFFHATVLSTVIEHNQVLDTDMNSGVTVLNAKLNPPSAAGGGRDDGVLFRKISLVKNELPEPSRASPELQRRFQTLQDKTKHSDYTQSYEHAVYNSYFHSPETEVTHYSGGRGREELSLPGEQLQIMKTDSQCAPEPALFIAEAEDSDVFQAMRVELDNSPTSTEPPLFSSEMDNLVDTLKSMDRPLRQRVQRTPSNTPFSSLPPIEEDAPITPLSPPFSPVNEPKTMLNGSSGLDFGFSWSSVKDMRSPLTMMKEQQFGDAQNRGLSLPLRASALSSIVMRRSSANDLSPEDGSAKGLINGASSSSRLENSFFFQPSENGASSRSIFRAASLPDIGSGADRISSAAMSTDSLAGSRFERFSYLTSPSNSLSGIAEASRISVAPFVQNQSAESQSFSHKSTSELYRSLPSETLLKSPPPLSLQRSSSLDGGFLINDNLQVNQKPEPERNLLLKYRAFPDAYLTKEKEHGKLNPRPGKMIIYDKPGFSGERIEVRGDVVDATPWEFTDTISVRVIRGGWVFYEKPDFKGEKMALDEGELELTDPFGPAEEEETDLQNESSNHGEMVNVGEEQQENQAHRKRTFSIGSIRRAVRDYSVPEISLFPEENAEGKKVTFRDTSDDARIFGFPIKANSIIINAGLWLVFAEPFFQGVPRVLEVGGFSSPSAWGVTHPYVGSLHPLKIGEPRVENLYEPRLVLYEKPYFTGKSRAIYSSMRDFLSRADKQQTLFMFSAGSLKVTGGCWVGYEKEGFRGNQYLLEEGEYHDWRVWGGVNSELRSVRVIQSDLSEPQLVLYAMPEQDCEQDEERTFDVSEAVADVELFGFGINTRSIHVLSGAWVAYSHVDYSGNQYVLEKGFYNNCGDWGSGDNRICSLQPILMAPSDGPILRNEVLLYSEPDFLGSCRVCHHNQDALSESLMVKSCRVVGGSWVLYGEEKFSGSMYVLSEGDYPNLSSMGLPADSRVRSVRAVPVSFCVPSVSLFGLECFEGREVSIDTQISSMQEEGFNTQFLSVRVNSGCWVLCEHSNYRGRQFLLEPIEITNWLKFSSVSCIGSLYPVRQKQRLFRIRNKQTGHCVSVQGGVEDMKTGRVLVSEQVEGMSDIWLYQDGLIKNKLARSMSLQVMGNVESGAKVVLWTETRVPVQTWSAQISGAVASITFPGMVLDIKGGKTYDKEHLVIREENEEQPSQQWELEFV